MRVACGLSVGKDADDKREGLGGFPSPVFENFNAPQKHGTVVGGKLSGGLQHQVNSGIAVVQMGLNAFLDQADDQLAQFGLSAEKFAAITRVQGQLDRADVFQKLEALTGRTHADAEAPDENIHWLRLGLGKEKPVNFPDRTGQAQDLNGMDKEIDGFKFKLRQWSHGLSRG